MNLHEYYKNGAPKNFPIEREFKIPASGGFQISDYCLGMERYFETTIREEVVVAQNKEDWFNQFAYYLAPIPSHEERRKTIQKAGTERVLREHTYQHRVKQLLSLLYGNYRV